MTEVIKAMYITGRTFQTETGNHQITTLMVEDLCYYYTHEIADWLNLDFDQLEAITREAGIVTDVDAWIYESQVLSLLEHIPGETSAALRRIIGHTDSDSQIESFVGNPVSLRDQCWLQMLGGPIGSPDESSPHDLIRAIASLPGKKVVVLTRRGQGDGKREVYRTNVYDSHFGDLETDSRATLLHQIEFAMQEKGNLYVRRFTGHPDSPNEIVYVAGLSDGRWYARSAMWTWNHLRGMLETEKLATVSAGDWM